MLFLKIQINSNPGRKGIDCCSLSPIFPSDRLDRAFRFTGDHFGFKCSVSSLGLSNLLRSVGDGTGER